MNVKTDKSKVVLTESEIPIFVETFLKDVGNIILNIEGRLTPLSEYLITALHLHLINKDVKNNIRIKTLPTTNNLKNKQ